MNETTDEPRVEGEPREELETRRRMAAAVETDDPAEALRGDLFTGLDRLAFALEWEAAEAVRRGDEEAAARLEDRRLGVRLAQRFVAGVHADEVDLRIQATRREYDARTGNDADVSG